MANKIITFNKDNSGITSNSAVYTDISMTSRYLYKKQPDITDDKYKLFITLAEERAEKLSDDYKLILTEKERTTLRLYAGINYEEYEREYLAYLSYNHYVISTNIDVRAVMTSLHNIFTWKPGERILNPEFGSKLHVLLYEGITMYNQERIAAEIRSCISRWEPRVQVLDIRLINDRDDYDDNTVHLEIIFNIPKLSNTNCFSYDLKFNTNA